MIRAHRIGNLQALIGHVLPAAQLLREQQTPTVEPSGLPLHPINEREAPHAASILIRETRKRRLFGYLYNSAGLTGWGQSESHASPTRSLEHQHDLLFGLMFYIDLQLEGTRRTWLINADLSADGHML